MQKRVTMRAVLVMAAGLVGLPWLTGCVAVGYTRGGGWFVWPGGLGLVVLLLVLYFVFRGRR